MILLIGKNKEKKGKNYFLFMKIITKPKIDRVRIKPIRFNENSGITIVVIIT